MEWDRRRIRFRGRDRNRVRVDQDRFRDREQRAGTEMGQVESGTWTGTRAKAVKRNRGQRKEINPGKCRQQEQNRDRNKN